MLRPGRQSWRLTTHVVARTSGASGAYYHRVFDGISWSPWEQIPLSIDGEPVMIFVWKNRLFLFWLQVSQQIPTAAGQPAQSSSDLATKKLNSDVTLGEMSSFFASTAQSSAPSVNILVTLFWSEYRNGKWQPAKSSDPANPAMCSVINASDQNKFDRASIVFDAYSDTANDRLWVKASRSQHDRQWLSASGQGPAYFAFYNTHSAPAIVKDLPGSLSVLALQRPDPELWRSIEVTDQTPSLLRVTRWGAYAPTEPLAYPIWDDDLITWKMQEITTRVVDPSDLIHLNLTDTPWRLPFLCADTCNAFYVTPTKISFEVLPKYGVTAWIPPLTIQLPPMLTKFWLVDPPDQVTNPVDLSQNVGTTNVAPITQFLTEDQFILRALGSSGAVRYGTANIGPAGSSDAANTLAGKR